MLYDVSDVEVDEMLTSIGEDDECDSSRSARSSSARAIDGSSRVNDGTASLRNIKLESQDALDRAA